MLKGKDPAMPAVPIELSNSLYMVRFPVARFFTMFGILLPLEAIDYGKLYYSLGLIAMEHSNANYVKTLYFFRQEFLNSIRVYFLLRQ